ncbi:MAG: hypothetical protein PVG48_02950 [Candidatus Bathyarchaeota archaeon]|jgi:hypothetical protein
MEIPNILIIAFVLSIVSGLYISNLGVIDATIIHFGFPLPWLEAGRSEFGVPYGPWRFTLLGTFFIDFLIYGAIVIIAMRIYEKLLEHISKPELYRKFLWLSAVLLVVVCWAVILWDRSSIPFLSFLWNFMGNYDIGKSFLRFLLGLMTIIFTWFLIKYIKQVSTPLATSSD